MEFNINNNLLIQILSLKNKNFRSTYHTHTWYIIIHCQGSWDSWWQTKLQLFTSTNGEFGSSETSCFHPAKNSQFQISLILSIRFNNRYGGHFKYTYAKLILLSGIYTTLKTDNFYVRKWSIICCITSAPSICEIWSLTCKIAANADKIEEEHGQVSNVVKEIKYHVIQKIAISIEFNLIKC